VSAARGLLVHWQQHEVRRQTLRAALMAVDLGTWGRDLAQSDDRQQPCWPVVSKCKHGACPVGNELQLCSGVRKGAPLLVIDEGALLNATTLHYRCRVGTELLDCGILNFEQGGAPTGNTLSRNSECRAQF
jgi:hypothetical protein